MRSLPGARLRPLASRTSSARLSGRWLILARAAWVVCALLLLANFVASIRGLPMVGTESWNRNVAQKGHGSLERP